MDNPFGPPVVNMDPEILNAMSRNFWNSAILRAGIKLNIFSLLERSGLSHEELVNRVGANPRFLGAFLNAASPWVCWSLGTDNTVTHRRRRASSSKVRTNT